MVNNPSNDTIAAVSTPLGEGGIGIVRLSGPDSVKIAARIFISSSGKKRPSEFKTHTLHYGRIVENAKGRKIVDEVLLSVMRAPATYTKEDVVEINCHGGMAALKKVLELAVKNGARMAEPGEFTKRAFLNGRLDLAQAEAVLDIIRAKTDAALRVSVGQLEGELSREINKARNAVMEICAEVEAAIDFPEEDVRTDTRQAWRKKISAIREDLEKLAASYHHGAILKDGITAVICGRANVGKSSLMNLLLKRDRVIVTPLPGTTRDAVEDMVNIRGIPIRLVDTAGIRNRNNIAEKAGIDKSRSYIKRADLILCVLDASERLKKDDNDLLNIISGRCAIIIINKCDLRPLLTRDAAGKASKNRDIVKISCLTKEGIDRLEDRVYNKVWSGNVRTSGQFMLNNVRHKEAVGKAARSLSRAEKGIHKRLFLEFIAVDIREGIAALGEIIGQTYTDDILDIIFSKFCIGK